MDTLAVVLEQPESLALRRLELDPPGEADVVVEIEWSGISTGTERLLWSGRMPHFPGMGYPLVPGYESVGRVVQAGARSGFSGGERVFVPGASCYGAVRGLFGGSASRVVVSGKRVSAIEDNLSEQGILLALAATAYHALVLPGVPLPGLIVGHGVLGRMLARIAVALGAEAPAVWERQAERMGGAQGYLVLHPDEDNRRDYSAIFDVSGDSALLDSLIARLAPGGQIVLAGFYSEPVAFAFPPAFMREASLRIAAQWQPSDLAAVLKLVRGGRLMLDNLITHRCEATHADAAYRTAFHDPSCLKMVLDWRSCS